MFISSHVAILKSVFDYSGFSFFYSAIFFVFPVINASRQFLHGTTSVPLDIREPNSRTRVTKMIYMTSSPEEKRKIIGDVFVDVGGYFRRVII